MIRKLDNTPSPPEDTPRQKIARQRTNYRPNPQYLKKGGKKPLTELSLPELEFCSWRAQGATVIDAARFSGIPASKLTSRLYRGELVMKTIDEMKKELVATVLDKAKQRVEETLERNQRLVGDMAVFTVGEYISRLRKMKTHKYRGDDSIVRLLDSGLKAAGFIQRAQINNQVGVSAAASAQNTTNQLYAKRLYLPDWRRETIEKLQNDERSDSGAAVPVRTELPPGQ